MDFKESDKINSIDEKLMNIVKSIEELQNQKNDISSQINDIYRQAKNIGFNTKAIRKIISLRQMETDSRVELETAVNIYKEALGMEV